MRALKRLSLSLFPDVLVVAGLVCLTIAGALVSPVLGLTVAGVGLIVAAWAVAYATGSGGA